MNLAQLIATTRGNRTQEQLAADAGMSIQNMQMYVSGAARKNFPDGGTIRNLARMCGVNPWTVVKAAAETIGIDTGIDGAKLAALLPPETATLDDDAIAAIRTLITYAGRPRTPTS